MQKHFSPTEGSGGVSFSAEAGRVKAPRLDAPRQKYQNVLIVSADSFVSSYMAEWSRLRSANARTAQSCQEAEPLIRGQGGRIDLLVMHLEANEAIKLLELAKMGNPSMDVMVILPGMEKALEKGSPELELLRKGAGFVMHRENEMFSPTLSRGLEILETGPHALPGPITACPR